MPELYSQFYETILVRKLSEESKCYLIEFKEQYLFLHKTKNIVYLEI